MQYAHSANVVIGRHGESDELKRLWKGASAVDEKRTMVNRNGSCGSYTSSAFALHILPARHNSAMNAQVRGEIWEISDA